MTGAPASSARPRADHVADLVDRDVEAEVAHPRDHQVATVLVGVGQRESVVAASLDRADLGERSEAAQQPSAVDAQLRVAATASAARQRERAHLDERRADRRDRRFEEGFASLGRRPRRIADVAARAEVVRQPPEADLAAETHVPVLGEVLGDVAEARSRGRRARAAGAASARSRRCRRARPSPARRPGRSRTCRPDRAARTGARGRSSARTSGAARDRRRSATTSCHRAR